MLPGKEMNHRNLIAGMKAVVSLSVIHPLTDLSDEQDNECDFKSDPGDDEPVIVWLHGPDPIIFSEEE